MFNKMKQKIGKYIPKTFDEVILVLLQTIIFILFFFTEALGTPTRNEYMAKSLTDAAKSSESGLVYSLIVPPSDASNFNYLEYHLSFLNSSDFIDDCYIFTINYCNYESNLYPFGVNINGDEVYLPVASIAGDSYTNNYFKKELVAGEWGDIQTDDIYISDFLANELISDSDNQLESFSDLIGFTIDSLIGEQSFNVVGVYKESSESYVDHYFSTDYIIGSFTCFSQMTVKARIGYVTGKDYLSNVYFLNRINSYINSKNYNRTTVVSLSGGDFDSGGNTFLSTVANEYEQKSTNVPLLLISTFLYVGYLVFLIYLFLKKNITKEFILFLGFSSFIMLVLFFGFDLILDLLLIGSSQVVFVNMTKMTVIFIFYVIMMSFIILIDATINKSKQVVKNKKNYEDIDKYDSIEI